MVVLIKEELSDHNTRVACIGPAGEKICLTTCIINSAGSQGARAWRRSWAVG